VTTIVENLLLPAVYYEQTFRANRSHNATRMRLCFIAVSMFDVHKRHSASNASAATWSRADRR
jgi:hypothetical protein